jgi:hypothetical protein
VDDPETFDPGGRFRSAIAASLVADPMPTFRTLAGRLGVPVDDVVHYALYRWAAAGSEAGDVERVRGIVAFLVAGEGEPA